MRFSNVHIAAIWTSPFVKWQGATADVSSLDLAVDVTGRALEQRGIDAGSLTDIVVGSTVPQRGSFYAAPTIAGRIGAPDITGPSLAQACATSVACLQTAAAQTQLQPDTRVLVVTTDRTSNGPVLVHPSPRAMGGAPEVETWVLDNFALDPWAQQSATEMAESVAHEAGVTRQELDEVTALRYEQYADSLRDDRAVQRRYMVEIAVPRRRKDALVIEADEGVVPTTPETLAALRPVREGGVLTFGNQTHPADATAGIVLVGGEGSEDHRMDGAAVEVLGTGVARVARGGLPKAPVPAARTALKNCGLDIDDVDVVVCHTPFAINDIWFSQETGFPLERMSPYGCSLVYGHPQAPVGVRAIAELCEALRSRGGGVGLFTGCAAGDTGAAVVIRVGD